MERFSLSVLGWEWILAKIMPKLQGTKAEVAMDLSGMCDGPNRKVQGTTRVPKIRSCPPRGWSGAGVGVGMLRGNREFTKIRRY